jgi:hypothetical protein
MPTHRRSNENWVYILNEIIFCVIQTRREELKKTVNYRNRTLEIKPIMTQAKQHVLSINTRGDGISRRIVRQKLRLNHCEKIPIQP